MASPERNPSPSVAEAPGLSLPVRQLPFFSLIGLLERLAPPEARVGEQGPPGAEVIRFRHDPALAFSAGDVAAVEAKRLPRDPADPLSPRRVVYEVTTTFLGLSGSATPLPSYLAEEVAQEDLDAPVQREFLDLFHHRLLSLFYRAVCGFAFWSEQASALRDRWSCRLLALLGFDAFDSELSSKVAADQLLRLSPLLASDARTAVALQLAIETVLGEGLQGGRVTIHEFAGSWIEIEAAARTRLGVANTRLGTDAVLGRRAFDRSGGFAIELGPISQPVYRRFLPEGDLLPQLQELADLFVRDPLDYEIRLVLAAGEAPRLMLGAVATRLGRDSWLGTPESEATVVLRSQNLARGGSDARRT